MTGALSLFKPGERRKPGPRLFTIGGLLGCGEALVLIGAPFSGKSAIAVAAARAVATGEPFFGLKVRRGLVVYVPAERYEETDRRLEVAFRGVADPPIRLANAKIYADDDGAERLASAINAMAEETGLPPVLVIFDTVAALLRDGAGDENLQRDVGKLTDAIDQVRQTTGAATIVVHHAKRGEKRSRGSDTLEGWADSVALSEGKGDQRKLSIIRSNTIETGQKAAFALAPFDLGEDVETGTRSSVVLAVPIERKAADRPAGPIRLPPDAATAFTALQALDDPITIIDWRSAVMRAFEAKPNAQARRQAFSSARTKLQEENLIIIDGDTVSVSRPSA